MCVVDLQRPKTGLDSSQRASRHPGRHIVATADGALLGTQQATVGSAAGGGTELRDTTGGYDGVPLLAGREPLDRTCTGELLIWTTSSLIPGTRARPLTSRAITVCTISRSIPMI